MKTCAYCGRENNDALTNCRECGTEFSEQVSKSGESTLSRRGRIIAGFAALVALAIAGSAKPAMLLHIAFFLLFYLPIYLPFLLSFAIKPPEWRGLRWSLRVGSVLAFFIRLSGISTRPDFGDDVAGNIAGAGHNIAWTWGSGVTCACGAVIIGLLLRLPCKNVFKQHPNRFHAPE